MDTDGEVHWFLAGRGVRGTSVRDQLASPEQIGLVRLVRSRFLSIVCRPVQRVDVRRGEQLRRSPGSHSTMSLSARSPAVFAMRQDGAR